jgi:hypothetical protein
MNTQSFECDETFQKYINQRKEILDNFDNVIPMLSLDQGLPIFKNIPKNLPKLEAKEIIPAMFEARRRGIFTWSDEVVEQFDRQQTELNNQIVKQNEIIEQATHALSAAIAQCEQSQIDLNTRRTTTSSSIDEKLIKLYDLKRNKRTTPAVADLHSATCQSCHLDLSTVELAALKKIADGELPECPNCDCYLVV